MMLTPHLLAGAAIGKAAKRPRLVIPLAFTSHLALDVVPHLDSHGLFGAARCGPTFLEAAVAVADFAIGLVVTLWLVHGTPWRKAATQGAVAGVILDLMDNVPPWGDWFSAWVGTAWLSSFHHGIQPRTTADQWLIGLGTQAAVIALCGAFLRYPPGPTPSD